MDPEIGLLWCLQCCEIPPNSSKAIRVSLSRSRLVLSSTFPAQALGHTSCVQLACLLRVSTWSYKAAGSVAADTRRFCSGRTCGCVTLVTHWPRLRFLSVLLMAERKTFPSDQRVCMCVSTGCSAAASCWRGLFPATLVCWGQVWLQQLPKK